MRTTGEMFKPKDADKGESFWRDKTSTWGRVIGDDAFLIRPNYPDFFELRDKLRGLNFEDASVQPWDVYQGPYIDLKGVDVGGGPYERGSVSSSISKAMNSCQIWKGEFPDEWSLDCGKNNRKLFGDHYAFVGDSEVILRKVKEIKDKL